MILKTASMPAVLRIWHTCVTQTVEVAMFHIASIDLQSLMHPEMLTFLVFTSEIFFIFIADTIDVV